MSLYIKDPDATLDFAFDWKPLTNLVTGATSDWLASGETISSYTITISSTDLVSSTDSQASGKVTVWLSGGTAGNWYDVACKITTSTTPARVDERTMKIQVKNR